jgi:ATP-dependent helicase/DNAse subunit B
MKILYYDYFDRNRRGELVKKCIGFMNEGLKAFYILPSREAMFDVRRLFAKEAGNVFNCHVIGFDDLERLVLEEFPGNFKIIGNMEERLILKHVLRELAPGSFFDKVKNKPGFLELLIRTVRKLKRQCVSPEEFSTRTAGLEGNLLVKCQAFYSIYSGYERIKTEKRLMDVDDISIKAANACLKAKLFYNTAVIVVDGFFNIDPVNIKLLENIQRGFSGISFYANVPYKNENNEQFLKNEVLRDFMKMGFETQEDEADSATMKNPCFGPIARHIYSGGGDIKADAENFGIVNSPCMDHEIRVFAGKAKELIRNQKVKPSDIAVITADTENYRQKMISIFEEYEIPLCVGRKTRLSSVPVIKDVMALWKLGLTDEYPAAFVSVVTSKYMLPFEVLLHEGFTVERLLKLAEEILKRKDKESCFGAFLDEYANAVENEPAKEAMKKYIASVCTFEKTLQEKPLDAVAGFEGFLEGVQIKTNLSNLSREGMIDEKMWFRDTEAVEELIKIFHRLGRAYGEYRLEPKDVEPEGLIRDILDMAGGIEIEGAAKETDGVRFFPPNLSRGQVYDTVFVLGVNEGMFPRAGSEAKLFDAAETKRLYDAGIDLGRNEWETEREKLRFNACVATASRRLYLSCRTADEDGNVMMVSPFIDEVISVLDKEDREKIVEKPVSMRERVSFKGKISSTGEAVKAVNTNLRNNSRIDCGIINPEVQKRLKYPAHAATIEFSREMGKRFDAYDGKLEHPVLAQQDISYGFSASQLNSYSRCSFTYFAQRVLDIVVDDDIVKEALDIGSFYHEVLSAYHSENQNPCVPDMEKLDAVFYNKADRLAFDSVPIFLKNLIIEDLLMILRNFITHDAQNMSRYYNATGCLLKPVMLEESFKMKLGEDKGILKGIADRVDLETDSKGDYTGRFIIYDYKKGGIKGIKECIEGKDFQLPLYSRAFNAVLKERFRIENPQCLAILYYSIEKLERNGIIRKDIKKALFEGRKGTRSTPDRVNMEVVLSWAEDEAVKVIDNIRAGCFMVPKNCPASSVFGCLYSGMCRYDRTRLARKEGVQ